jgi:hypothetical protein
MGQYARCVKLDDSIIGQVSLTYLDYESEKKTTYFSYEIEIQEDKNGKVYAKSFSSSREKSWSKITMDNCVKAVDQLNNGDTQYYQDLPCFSKNAIRALNDLDPKIPHKSNW